MFWLAILFTSVNGFIFHNLFSDMFDEFVIVMMSITMHIIIFALLPHITSKHLYEFIQKSTEERKKATENKIVLFFEAIISVLFMASYLFVSVQNRQAYEGQAQIVLVVAIDAFPLITSIALGFMNYRRLKKGDNTE